MRWAASCLVMGMNLSPKAFAWSPTQEGWNGAGRAVGRPRALGKAGLTHAAVCKLVMMVPNLKQEEPLPAPSCVSWETGPQTLATWLHYKALGFSPTELITQHSAPAPPHPALRPGQAHSLLQTLA